MADKPGLSYPTPGTPEATERYNRIKARQAAGQDVNPNYMFMLRQGVNQIGSKLLGRGNAPRSPYNQYEEDVRMREMWDGSTASSVNAANAEDDANMVAEGEANMPAPTRMISTNIGSDTRLSVQKNGNDWTPYNAEEGREYEPTESIGDTGATPRMLDGGMYTNERHKDFYDKAFSDGEESGTSQMALDGYLQDHGIRVTSKNGWEGALSEYQTKYGLEATGQMDDQTKAHIKASLKSAEEIRNDITNSSRTL